MSAALVTQVMKLRLPSVQKWLLVALAWRAKSDGTVDTNIRELQKDTGLGHSTIRFHLAELKDDGILQNVEQSVGRKSILKTSIALSGGAFTSPLDAPLDVSPPIPPPSLSPPIIPPSRYSWAEILGEIPTYKATVEQEHRTQERMSKAGFTANEIETAAMALVGSKLRDKYVRHDMALYNWVAVARKRNGPVDPTDVVDWEAEKAKYG